MAIAFVQAKANSNGGGGGTTVTVTPTSALTTGNAVAGGVTFGSGNTADLTSVTDNAGNTYTIVRRVADSGNGQSAASFCKENISGSPTVITATFASSLTFCGLNIQEFSGVATSSALDTGAEQGQFQASPGTGTDAVKSGAGTLTPSVAGCVVFGFTVDTSSLGITGAHNPGTNFTEPAGADFSNSGDIEMDSEYWIQTTATAANASFTVAAANSYITFMLTLKPPAAAIDAPGGRMFVS